MKKSYQTGQRKKLLDYLGDHAGEQLTIEEIVEGLSGQGGIGKSTIYRNIKELVEEGTVKRFTLDNSRHFHYQIVNGQSCHSHLHLQCEKCGTLLHLQDSVSQETLNLIAENCGFDIDKEKTMLFGVCKDCRNKNESL